MACAHMGSTCERRVHRGDHRPPTAPLLSRARAPGWEAPGALERSPGFQMLPSGDLTPTARCPPLPLLSGASFLKLELMWTPHALSMRRRPSRCPRKARVRLTHFLLRSHTAAAVRGAGGHLVVIGAMNN